LPQLKRASKKRAIDLFGDQRFGDSATEIQKAGFFATLALEMLALEML
jgi:hypothetical protein